MLKFYQKQKSVTIVFFELISLLLGYLRKCAKCSSHNHNVAFVISSKNVGPKESG